MSVKKVRVAQKEGGERRKKNTLLRWCPNTHAQVKDFSSHMHAQLE